MTSHLPAEEGPPAPAERTPPAPPAVSFSTAFWYWLRLGCISFGGPAGQIAIMHAELVERRRWISERRFLHALNYCMLLPGPEAQQLATYIGWLLHGVRGGLVAGGLFILPSLFLLLGLSALYVAYGQTPVVVAILDSVKPAVVAIVAAAVLRLGRRAIKNGVLLAFAVAAFFALAVFHVPFPLVVLVAGLLGWLGAQFWPAAFVASTGHGGGKPSLGAAGLAAIDDHHPPPPHAQPSRTRFALTAACGLLLWAAPLLLLVAVRGWDDVFTRMAWLFTTAALVTFGGAYAVLPYVAQQAVEVYGWLKPSQMVDGLALGETTPGPLIMVVSFVGFVAGWQASELGWSGAVWGCLLATYFTFLPSFLFILLGAPLIEQMRGELRLAAALTGITAAVVGVVLSLAFYFGGAVFVSQAGGLRQVNGLAVSLAVVAFVALVRFQVSLGHLVAACALAGWVRYLIAG